MRKKIKNIFTNILFLKRKISTYSSYKKRYKAILKNSKLKNNLLVKEEKEEYLNYWKEKGFRVNLDTVQLTKMISGKFDKRIIPEEIFSLYLEPKLNVIDNITFLENKNIYNKWFREGMFPKDYFHKINNTYYDASLHLISDINLFIDETNFTFPIVFKPSCDSYGGKDVFFIDNKEELKERAIKFKNIVVQEKIIQHKKLNEIYSDSINTVRVCLLRRIVNSDIVVLNTSLRMGKDGSLDNETAGGIVNSISSKGLLNDYSVNKFGTKYYEHPNSKVSFKGIELPNFEALLERSKDVAIQVPHANLFSIDMCLDDNGTWRCIEINLSGQTIRFAQYAGKPFLGKYTDEIILKNN